MFGAGLYLFAFGPGLGPSAATAAVLLGSSVRYVHPYDWGHGGGAARGGQFQERIWEKSCSQKAAGLGPYRGSQRNDPMRGWTALSPCNKVGVFVFGSLLSR